MTKAHVYYKSSITGKKHDITYSNVLFVKAGTAGQVLGPDAAGNGIDDSAPVIQLILDDNTTATFDADNVTIMF